MVEFAFVAPLLFLVMFTLGDFALAELSDAAGANAAREGARVGVLHFDGAQAAGPNNTKITDAVRSKLAGNIKGPPLVKVRCLNKDGSARPGDGSCSTVAGDAIEVGADLIEVSVTWTRRGGMSPFIADAQRSDKAVMRIVGSPPTSSAPVSLCVLTGGTASPASVVRAGTSLPAIRFEVTLTDAALCGAPLLDLTAQSGYGAVQTMVPVNATTFEFTMPSGQGSWTSGVKTVQVSANGGSVTRDISFTVSDPAVCLITSASALPSAVTQSSGTLSSAVVFTVLVSNLTTCGTPSLAFPVNAGYAGPQPMVAAGGTTFTFTMPIGKGTWASQTYGFTATAATAPSAPISVVVSSAPVCTLSNLTISPTIASVKKTGQNNILSKVTIRVTRSSLTVCGVPTVAVTPGSSGPAGTTDLTIPKVMRNVGSSSGSCTAITCEWVIALNTTKWLPAPSARTVTVAASGSTRTGTLTLT